MSQKRSLYPATLAMLLLWTVALPCAAITPVLNGRQPDEYSVPKQKAPRSGTIDSINAAAHTIVIDGTTYRMPHSVVIHTGRPSTVAARLVAGTAVRFRATEAQLGRQPVLTEIWFADGDK